MENFDTDPAKEAQILKRLVNSDDDSAFLDSARRLLDNPEEFKQVQALMQPGKTGYVPGLTLVEAQPGDRDTGSKPTPNYIKATMGIQKETVMVSQRPNN